MKRDFSRIKMEIEDNICYITMNFPKSLNALSSITLEEMLDAVIESEKNSEVQGIIITGTGKAFVAGADISQMKDYGAEEGRKYAKVAQDIFSKIENLEKPVIAAINGYALGGGCELAMACDIRIASDKAILGQPEVNLGVIPCLVEHKG